MPVNKKARVFYFKIFDGTETAVANAIMIFQERRIMKKCVKNMPKLTSEQKKAVREFWKPYCRVSTDWARYYTNITGKFDPRYIPNDLYFTKIDQHFNNRKYGYGFNDKNYYYQIFHGIKQPKTVVRKIGGLLFDEEYHQIDLKKAEELLAMRSEVVVKPSTENGCGRGIEFYGTKADADTLKAILLSKSDKNIIIQDLVKQHPELAKMHPQSLNTIRVYSLMLEDGVHILSAHLRMGAGDSRIDNLGSGSAVMVRLKDSGELYEQGYTDYYTGKRVDRHPDGMPFTEIKVPEFDKVIETVKRAAQYIGNFRMVAWDFSVDEDGDVVLMEANMRKGGLYPAISEFGSMFGNLTEKVLDEVFGRK